ncbi:MAG: hypothetical protein U1F20_07090 [Lysobacterales bacterium]
MYSPQNSKLWAGYFLLLCAFFVLGLLAGTHNLISLINNILTGISLVGLWGYLSQKAIGSRLMWAAMLVMQSLGVIATLLMLLASDMPLAFSIFASAFTFPLLLALFRYVFRSPNIWPAGVPEA